MITAEFCCLDASAFSLGFAAAHGGTLLLEKSENGISDYVNAVIPGSVSAPVSDEGKAFADFLKKSGCVSESGLLDSPSLAPAAAEYALNFDIILNATVISIEKADGGYKILIHTNGGLQKVFCRQIICRPTTPNNIKFLNCVVSGTDLKTLLRLKEYGAIINESFEKDEFIISLPFEPQCNMNEARIRFTEIMKKCFGTSVIIDAFAADFAVGSACGDIIKDFEAGVGFNL